MDGKEWWIDWKEEEKRAECNIDDDGWEAESLKAQWGGYDCADKIKGFSWVLWGLGFL